MKIFFDIGGTNTRVGLYVDKKNFELDMFSTYKSYSQFISYIQNNLLTKLSGQTIDSVVVGIAGTLNESKTKLIKSPNLGNWVNKKISRNLSDIFGTKVFLENDTALVGLGEAMYGAGRKHKLVSYLTFSTGVGGVRIENKKITENSAGFEPGKQILSLGKEQVTIEDLFERLQKENNDSDTNLKEEIHNAVAVYIYNTSMLWSTELIVLGGGMINSEYLDIEKISTLLKTFEYSDIVPKIKKAKLGDFGGLWGALVFSNQMDANS